VVGKIASHAHKRPEEQAYNSAGCVRGFGFWPERPDKSVASALDDELKEHLKDNASDDADESSECFPRNFPKRHDCPVGDLTAEFMRAAKRPRMERIVRAQG